MVEKVATQVEQSKTLQAGFAKVKSGKVKKAKRKSAKPEYPKLPPKIHKIHKIYRNTYS